MKCVRDSNLNPYLSSSLKIKAISISILVTFRKLIKLATRLFSCRCAIGDYGKPKMFSNRRLMKCRPENPRSNMRKISFILLIGVFFPAI